MRHGLSVTGALAMMLAAGSYAYGQETAPDAEPIPPGDAAQDQQPAAQDQAPAAEEQQPAAQNEQPPAEDQPPAAQTEQPPVQDGGQAPADTEMQAEDQAEPSADGGWLTTQDEQEYRAANVIGVSVMNAEDEEIGEITDLVLDSEDKVVGVVLSVGGFLGIGDKWVGIPIDQIEFNREEETAMADYTSDELENAPEFTTLEEKEAEEEAATAQEQMQSPTGMTPAPAPQPAQ